MPEYIKDVTHGFAGPRLDGWQLAQRGYRAGFTDAKVLAIFVAVMRAESGGYLRAYHNNVAREEDGSISRFEAEDGTQLMQVRSTDLGLIQRNVPHDPPRMIAMDGQSVAFFINELFAEHSDLANGQESADVARTLYVRSVREGRPWAPWVAYRNGGYRNGLPSACTAIANYLDKILNDASGHEIARKEA